MATLFLITVAKIKDQFTVIFVAAYMQLLTFPDTQSQNSLLQYNPKDPFFLKLHAVQLVIILCCFLY